MMTLQSILISFKKDSREITIVLDDNGNDNYSFYVYNGEKSHTGIVTRNESIEYILKQIAQKEGCQNFSCSDIERMYCSSEDSRIYRIDLKLNLTEKKWHAHILYKNEDKLEVCDKVYEQNMSINQILKQIQEEKIE